MQRLRHTIVEYIRNISLRADLAIQTIFTDYMDKSKCIGYFNILKRVLLIINIILLHMQI